MNMLVVTMLLSAGISGIVASGKDRSPVFWLALGLVTGPIAVAVILWLPSHAMRTARASLTPSRSIVDEINGLEEMRQRGLITDDEFRQGKVQILAWPIDAPIPPALTPQRVWADGRRTWASYQAATRDALIDLARRHELELRWRDDVPFEVVATFAVQPGLSVEFSLGLEKGMIHCWGDGWSLGAEGLNLPTTGLPRDLEDALDALIEGKGRIVIRTAEGSASPFRVSLQIRRGGKWQTVSRRSGLPAVPVWRRRILMNTDPESRASAKSRAPGGHTSD
jgi:hypothetical protein